MGRIFYRPAQVDAHMMCKRKVKFQSKERAEATNTGQRAYRCPYCNGWHLASQKEPK